MISPWLGIPLAAITMVFIAGHLIALGSSDQPLCRKRIRQINGTLAMFTVPAICVGSCIFIYDESTREWALTWIAVMMLVAVHVLLAMADAVNTARLRRHTIGQIKDASSKLREDFAILRAHLDGDTVDLYPD